MTLAVCPSCSRQVATVKGTFVSLYVPHSNERGEECWRSRCPVLPCYMVPAGHEPSKIPLDDLIFTHAATDRIVRLLLAEMDFRWE